MIMSPASSEFIIERVFNAPRKIMFKAWTDPERLKQWWGPKGFKWVDGKMDLRPGGIFHYGMRSPEGSEMWGKFVYSDIVKPERLDFIVSFSDMECNTLRHPASPSWPLEVLNSLTFSEQDGKTTVVLKGFPINATEEERDTFKAGHHMMQQGFKGTLDQLDEYLSNMLKEEVK